MSAQSDGGAAFPTVFPDGTWLAGMTLRDWFAGLAMSGLMNDRGLQAVFLKFETNMEPFARDAYAMADAMLAERAKAVQS